MQIVILDLADGLGEVEAIVATRIEADRLRSYMRDASQYMENEPARVAADVAYNRAKNNGSLLAAEIERARINELKWSAT